MSEHQTDPAPKSENEIADYYDGVKKLEIKGYETGIKKARTALFVTAGLLLLGEIISGSTIDFAFTPLMIGIIVFEVGIFIALALWTKTKPYTAIITGIIIFILLWGASIVVLGGKAVYSGIIVKIIIIVNLISALKPAKAWEDAKKNS
ncbi:MAG: hypothetical protein LH619_10685 [Chitinophagaceae bacterium]|nr:hypothetical protein [Chitinophagaceae bacterium]